MTTTTAVWEWRTFGGGWEEAERAIRAYPLKVGPRRATHIVSNMSGSDARVADGELYVRVLKQASGELEQWRTVLRAPMPVDDATVRRMFGYLDLRPPTTSRPSYSLHQFMSEIIAPQHALTAVPVGQICHVGIARGCTVELAELMINEMPWKTLALEGDDPAALTSLLVELGLSGRPNTNFVAALKQQLAGVAKP